MQPNDSPYPVYIYIYITCFTSERRTQASAAVSQPSRMRNNTAQHHNNLLQFAEHNYIIQKHRYHLHPLSLLCRCGNCVQFHHNGRSVALRAPSSQASYRCHALHSPFQRLGQLSHQLLRSPVPLCIAFYSSCAL